MNRLTEALADACRRRPLCQKWLIAPSMRVGHQWLDTITRAGISPVNVRVKTIKSTAIDLALPEMVGRGVSPASQRAVFVLVDRLLRELRDTDLEYLGQLPPSAAMTETIRRSLQSLRMAGLRPEDLTAEHFEAAGKGRDLGRILHGYLQSLRQRNLIDHAEVTQIATSRLQTGGALADEQLLVLWPRDLAPSPLEERLRGALPKENHLLLPVDEPVDPRREISTDVDLLPWVGRPADAPTPKDDQTVEIFPAVGEVNEVREVLRRCLARGIPLDDVELLHTDPETFVPLVYESLASWMPRGDGEGGESGLADDLPVTFAEGIPCRYSRPGRLLAAWVAWIGEDFPQATLVRIVRDGLLTCPESTDGETRPARLASVLRTVGIGFGRRRYVSRMDSEIAGLERRLESSQEVDSEEGADEAAARQGRWERRLDDLRILRRLIDDLLAVSPEPGAEQADVLAAARDLLGRLAHSVDRADNFACQRLIEEIKDLAYWIADGDGPLSLDVWSWLAELPRAARISGSGPRPGCLHVAGVLTGGHSGRRHICIVGLDDGRFPGTGSQDPLLLDVERRAVSADLPTAASRLEEKLLGFARMLARLRGRLTLSFASRNLRDDREQFPSALLLAVYRLVSGNRQGTQQDMLDGLPAAASFAPPEADSCPSDTQWWLWRLCGTLPVQGAAERVARHYPHLACGAEATGKRHSAAFTEYDGHVERAGYVLDPTAANGPVMSSGRLELLGRCPLAFFFHYGLNLVLPDELEIDTRRWLDPLTLGHLLHVVFEQFVGELAKADALPFSKTHGPVLRAVVDRQIEAYRATYPPPSEHVFQSQVRHIEQTARVFLTEEIEFCQRTGGRPMYMEASLGMRPEAAGTPLDSPEPVPVALADGRELLARGRVDRVDRLGDSAEPEYAIWDYKTGSTWKYDRGDPFRQGRVVQPFVYLAMVNHRLRTVVGANARAVRFGFFFPNPQQRGDRITWSAEQLAAGRDVLNTMAGIVRHGAFSATDDKNDCDYCDYASICGDVNRVTADARAKLEDPGNVALDPFRQLRGRGIDE